MSLDDHILADLRIEGEKRKFGLQNTINEVLRLGLIELKKQHPMEVYLPAPFDLKPRFPINIDSTSALLELLDELDAAAELAESQSTPAELVGTKP